MNKYLIQRRKIKYYLKNSFALFIPKVFFRIRINYELKKINNYDLKYLESRVNYYNKIEKKSLPSNRDIKEKKLKDELSKIHGFKLQCFAKISESFINRYH